MPEPVTAFGIAALASYVGKDPLQRLLGPTCDMLGRRFSDLTESGIDAVGRIVRNARAKAGDALEQPGSVPPRVLKEVIDAGSGYTEDINIEYMGGVLASSRTPQGRDDRGARMAKLVDRLSTYQLRTHYLIYGSIKHLFAGHMINLGLSKERYRMRVYLPLSSYCDAMQFTKAEGTSGYMLGHILHGLSDENLIEFRASGSPDKIKSQYKDAEHPGIICGPSVAGTELFLWAFGHGDKPFEFILDNSFSAHIDDLPPYLEGAMVAIVPSESSSSETS